MDTTPQNQQVNQGLPDQQISGKYLIWIRKAVIYSASHIYRLTSTTRSTKKKTPFTRTSSAKSNCRQPIEADVTPCTYVFSMHIMI